LTRAQAIEHTTEARSAAVPGERERARDVEDEGSSMGQRQIAMAVAVCTWLDGNEKSVWTAQAGVVTSGMYQKGRGDWYRHLRRTLHHSVKPHAKERIIPSRGSHVHSAIPAMNRVVLSVMRLLIAIATMSRKGSRRPASAPALEAS